MSTFLCLVSTPSIDLQCTTLTYKSSSLRISTFRDLMWGWFILVSILALMAQPFLFTDWMACKKRGQRFLFVWIYRVIYPQKAGLLFFDINPKTLQENTQIITKSVRIYSKLKINSTVATSPGFFSALTQKLKDLIAQKLKNPNNLLLGVLTGSLISCGKIRETEKEQQLH